MPDVDSKTILRLEGVPEEDMIDGPGYSGANLSAVLSGRSVEAATRLPQALTAPPAGGTVGGTAVTATALVLLLGQDNGAENGPWKIGTPWTRPAWFANGGTQRGGMLVYVQRGDLAKRFLRLDEPDPCVVGTSPQTWHDHPAGQVLSISGGDLPDALYLNLTGNVAAEHDATVPGGQLNLDFPVPVPPVLDDIVGVDLTGNPSQGDTLTFDGTKWTNVPATSSSFTAFATGWVGLHTPQGVQTNTGQPIPSAGQNDFFNSERHTRVVYDLTYATEVQLSLSRAAGGTIASTAPGGPRVRVVWSSNGTNWFGFNTDPVTLNPVALPTMPDTTTVTATEPWVNMTLATTTYTSGWVAVPPAARGPVHLKLIWEGGDNTTATYSFGKTVLLAKVPVPTSPPPTVTIFEKYMAWDGLLAHDDTEYMPAIGLDGSITEIIATLQTPASVGQVNWELYKTAGNSPATQVNPTLVFAGNIGQGVTRKTNAITTTSPATTLAKMDRLFLRVPNTSALSGASELGLTIIGRRNA